MRKLSSQIIVVIFIGFIIIPIVFLAIWSLSTRWPWPLLYPESITIKWWNQVLFESKGFYLGLKNTLIIGISTAIIGVGLSIPIGKYLVQKKSYIKSILEGVFFLPIILSPLTITLGLYQTFSKWNLTGSMIGVIIAHLIPCLPYGIRIMKISFEHFNEKYLEQGKMLKASKRQRQIYIIFPFLRPGIIAAFHLMLLISMSQYILTIFIGSGKIQTLASQMYPYLNGGNMSIGGVYSLLFALIAILMLLIVEYILKKYLDRPVKSKSNLK